MKDSEHLPIEAKFDTRLIEKKLEQKFMTRQERDTYLKAIPEEKEFEFTSMDEVEILEDNA